jgi:hypothetical protein
MRYECIHSPLRYRLTSVRRTSVSRRVKQLVSAEGIEPSTNGLKGRCSAIELRARLAKQDFITNWLSGQGQFPK